MRAGWSCATRPWRRALPRAARRTRTPPRTAGSGVTPASLSEQESMDKSHGSGDATPTTPPNMFENPLLLSDAQSSGASDTQTTPDAESDARELIMEDMSCQTGDDLLENGNEAEADPGANEHERRG